MKNIGKIKGVEMMQPQPLENLPFTAAEKAIYKRGVVLKNKLQSQLPEGGAE